MHSSDSEKCEKESTPVFGDEAFCMICPFCRHEIITAISYNAGTLCWFLCGLMIFLGLWLGCCLVPFYVNAVKDCVHSCPNCWQILGRFNRL